jgi:hypothetical protein
MAIATAFSTREIKARGSIKDTDVLRLRRVFYENGCISTEEAETLFELNDACPVQDATWADCFIEMLTDYLVNQVRPEGYLTADNADWLIARIAKDGKVNSKTELDLLVNVLDKARWAPERLVRFALEQVKIAVISGNGPLRTSCSLDRGCIGAGEVELLRRILYAFGGDGNTAITRTEAEVLFEIDAATAAAQNHPSWRDLFVKAIANCVMVASGYAPPTREEALAREAWLDRRGELSPANLLNGVSHKISGSIIAGFKPFLSRYRGQSVEDRTISRLERQKIEIITNEQVTEAEAAWLAGQIGRSGKPTANEQALLEFLQRECPKSDPLLRDLIDKMGRAA